MLTTILLSLTLSASPARPCTAGQADADIVLAEGMYYAAKDERRKNFALAFLTSAMERRRTTLVMCEYKAQPMKPYPLDAKDNPFAKADTSELDAVATVMDVPAKLDELQSALAQVVRP
jgi:hypothetical protein